MTRKIAAFTAASRGFPNVSKWMSENRRAAANFRSRMNSKSEDKAKLQTLIDSLDREYSNFKHLA